MAKHYFEFTSAGLNTCPERVVSVAKSGAKLDGFTLDGKPNEAAGIAVSYYDQSIKGFKIVRPSNYWLMLPLFIAKAEDGDLDIHLVHTRPSGVGGNFTNTGGGIFLACDSTALNYYTVTSGGANAFYITQMQRINGANTYPQSIIQTSAQVGGDINGVKRHLRVKIVAGVVSAKRWIDGTPEPDAWAMTFNNALGFGALGLFVNGENITDTTHSFAIGTQGDQAPTLLDAPVEIKWGIATGMQPGDRLFLADNLSLSPITQLLPNEAGAWVQAISGYVPPSHVQLKGGNGAVSIIPTGVNGDGYLGGTYPNGGVTDQGAPVGPASIEILLRNPGGAGNGAIVGSATTDLSGSWRYDGLSLDGTFDVIARYPGRNDVMASRVKAEQLVSLAAAGSFSALPGGLGTGGAIKLIGGRRPFDIEISEGRLPYGTGIALAGDGSFIVPSNPKAREAGNFSAKIKVTDGADNLLYADVAVQGLKRPAAAVITADAWNGGSLTLTRVAVTVPATVQAGDLLIIGLIHREASRSLIPPVSSEPGVTFAHHGSSNAYSSVTGSTAFHWLDIYSFRATAATAGSVLEFVGPTGSYKFVHLTGVRSSYEALMEVKRHEISATNPIPAPARYAIPEVVTKGGLVIAHTAHPFAYAEGASLNQWGNAKALSPASGASGVTLRGGSAWYWQQENIDQMADYYCGGYLGTGAIAISRLYIDEVRPDLPGW